ncbi:unnamed protein product [Didymodactylos carnosus]|uniref:Uncharacterized protein n=2 Tax=Didymodactylos carnosus TaxID=1234261 RepID=A0A8S2HKT4_9BILA|nr:unnamed protein product [Didymodactylos carnosus]CAF3658377.1 unnamed protein product [Didymodactylos carnosus]
MTYEVSDGNYWSGLLPHGNKTYCCPVGWTRFGIQVTRTQDEFDKRWGNWYVAYHGTKSSVASLIVNSGLKAANDYCWTKRPCVYLSPSIEYCAYSRYAEPWKRSKNQQREQKYYQLVFQCCVNPRLVSINPETILRNEQRSLYKIDNNFSNDELEWIIDGYIENLFSKIL